MVLCTCPIRCKGGREVTERTRAKHEKEIQEQERLQRIQKFFPDHDTSQSNKRGRANDEGEDTLGTQSKRTRGGNQQRGVESQAVSL